MVTIRNKVTGKTQDVSPEKWREIQGRSRNYEKIGESKKPAMRYAAKSKKEETATDEESE